MEAIRGRCGKGLIVALAAGASGGVAQANLLTDPGFESNPLTTAANSLGNFPGFQGVWGQEASVIVGVDGGITPASGSQQLRLDFTAGVATQAFQTVDVSGFAALIDSGLAQADAGILLNAPGQGRIGGIYLSFFTGASYGTIFGPTPGSVLNPLDANSSTWELASLLAPIPAGTRWILFQVAYNNASLQDATGAVGSGYADDAYLRIVPAPGGAAVAAIGLLAASRRKRR